MIRWALALVAVLTLACAPCKVVLRRCARVTYPVEGPVVEEDCRTVCVPHNSPYPERSGP